MTIPTLSQLADIGAKAAYGAIDGTLLVVLDAHSSYEEQRPAREAFAKAVLDAVGYKFPVDPEREAFERWLARQSSDDKPDLFTVWQAGKASHTTTEPAAPETFEAHGLTWFKHTPGDPCPCDGDVGVAVLLRGCIDSMLGAVGKARGRCWDTSPALGSQIVGWRYADAP